MAGIPKARLPPPTSKYAPKFRGLDSQLTDFMDEYEAMAKSAMLDDQEKINNISRYAIKFAKELWTGLPEKEEGDWNTYKNAIIALYPGADETDKFAVEDLLHICTKQSKKIIQNQTSFGAYDRHFQRVYSWLQKNQRISSSEAERYYWKGIPKDLRRRIAARLQIQDATWTPNTVPERKSVKKAAEFVLRPSTLFSDLEDDDDDSGDSAGDQIFESNREVPEYELSDDEEEKKPAKRSSRTQKSAKTSRKIKEEAPSGTLTELLKAIQAQNETIRQESQAAKKEQEKDRAQLTQALAALASKVGIAAQPQDEQGSTTSQRPSVRPLEFFSSPTRDCSFCGNAGHFIRSCPDVAVYESQGKCKRSAEGYIMSATGGKIPSSSRPGMTLKARIDDQIQAFGTLFTQKGTSSAASGIAEVNFVSAVPLAACNLAASTAAEEFETKPVVLPNADIFIDSLKEQIRQENDYPMATQSKTKAQPPG